MSHNLDLVFASFLLKFLSGVCLVTIFLMSLMKFVIAKSGSEILIKYFGDSIKEQMSLQKASLLKCLVSGISFSRFFYDFLYGCF